MGWWWVPLVLVLPLWLPGSPGLQAGAPGLWRWVALVSWLPGVQPCLLCFGPHAQREKLCHDITGAFIDTPRHQQCLEALVKAAVPLSTVTVGSEQRQTLQVIVADAMDFLLKQKGKKSFEVSLQEAVNRIWDKLSWLEEAPACIPPCGYQPAARFFQCATCHLTDCPFPLDCPMQDVWASTDDAVTLRCNVPFATSLDPPITWMFAKDLRTQDLTMFEELQGAEEGPVNLTIHEPTQGTIACRLGELSKPFARKYFYLNVSGGSVEAEKRLQALFRDVLRWTDWSLLHHRTWLGLLLGLGLALGAVVLVLLVVGIWKCCDHPDFGDSQTSPGPGQRGPPNDYRRLDSP